MTRSDEASVMQDFKRRLRLVIAVNALLGLVLLLWPGLVAEGAGSWTRGIGLALLLLALAVAPAAVVPQASRYLGLFAAVAQIALGLFMLFTGATIGWLFAIYAASTAYLLLSSFWRGFRAALMAKP